MAQRPTKSPIVCLGSDNRHWSQDICIIAAPLIKLGFLMQISDAESGHDLPLCPRLDGRPRRNRTGAPTQRGRLRKVFREKITGTTADRPQLRALMKKLTPGDVVITPAVDRLSRDTTDLLIIARDMQRAGAGIRSLAEPFLDTTSDFAEIIFAILGVAAKLERRRILERTARGRAPWAALSSACKPASRERLRRRLLWQAAGEFGRHSGPGGPSGIRERLRPWDWPPVRASL